MAGQLSTILGCLLAVGIVAVGADTVSSYLGNNRQFNFQFEEITFIGTITKIRDGATTATTCKIAGMLEIDVIKKDEMSIFKFKPKAEKARVTVCLNGGCLEIRPITDRSSDLEATGVTISDAFWKKCGIPNRRPTDQERKDAGNAMLASLNSVVIRLGQ